MKTKRQVLEKFVFYYRENYDRIIEEHKKQFVDGKCSFEEIAYYAFWEYALYEKSREESCVLWGIRALTDLGKLSDEFLRLYGQDENGKKTEGQNTIREAIFKNGRPWGAPMDGMFRPFYYLQAVRGFIKCGRMGREELDWCEKAASRSLKAIMAHTDWGPQNRGMIKGVNLLLAADCFPDNVMVPVWKQLGEALVKENIGQWSVEDAQIYIPVWLNAMITYEELFGENVLKTGQVKFYFDYITELLCPLGVVSDFGDARFGESTEAYLCCMEKGAALYGDGRMKEAADRLWRFYEEEILSKAVSPDLNRYSDQVKNVAFVAQAMLREDKEVIPEQLSFESRELLEDLVGKKYRLAGQSMHHRDYLFLNYRDEGNHAGLPGYYIRNTLSVENEKTHHGHGDENAIVMLLADDTVLLHDGGYRETGEGYGALPGNYRSDFFHNRMVFRRDLPEEPEGLMEFFSKECAYCPVTSKKLYFERFPHCDVGRTQVYDEKRSAQYDRTVVYLKREGAYLVIDSLKALAEGDYTAAVIYFTGVAAKTTENCYRTQISKIATDGSVGAYHNKPGWELDISFVNQEYPVRLEKLRRCYTQETALCQHFAGKLSKGEVLHMVSVLQPVKSGAVNGDPIKCKGEGKAISCKIVEGVRHAAEVQLAGKAHPAKAGLGLIVETECASYRFQCRTELFLADKATVIRPLYDREESMITYGDITTDAMFSYVCNEEALGLVLGSGLFIKDREIFRVPEAEYIQPDFDLQTGRSYWNRWYQEKENIHGI